MKLQSIQRGCASKKNEARIPKGKKKDDFEMETLEERKHNAKLSWWSSRLYV